MGLLRIKYDDLPFFCSYDRVRIVKVLLFNFSGADDLLKRGMSEKWIFLNKILAMTFQPFNFKIKSSNISSKLQRSQS